ncbi:MAG: hypothetical protein WBD78_10690, partial [Methylocella sp.]
MPNTRDVPFRVPAIEEALARRGKPEIFDTGQGSRFTGAAFAGTLAAGIRVPMDGRGRWEGQCLHRAAAAWLEGRGHPFEGLCRRPRGAGRDRGLDRVPRH